MNGMTPDARDALFRHWDEVATRQMREEVGPSEDARRAVNAISRRRALERAGLQ